MKKRREFDFGIFITVLVLVAMGLVTLFSASVPYSFYQYGGDTYRLIKNQMLWALLGFIAMSVMICIDYRKLGKYSPIFLMVSIALLVIVLLLPGRDGIRRWIEFKGFSFQPSEIAKLALIIFLSYSLSKNRDRLKYFLSGLLPYLIIVMFVSGLVLVEPHLSATVIIVLISCVLLFLAGARIMHFVLLTVPGLAGLVIAIAAAPYRLKRITGFLDPWSDIQGDGWQIVQSLYAIGPGGLFGRGLGKSLQKFLYLPAPHNDFIFSVLAEELGFVGAATVVILFLVFIWRGIKVALNAPDLFGSLLAAGITALIGFQAMINIAVVTSSMPVTGMQLPFFSYGGTSLLLLMAGVGILLNISRYAKSEG